MTLSDLLLKCDVSYNCAAVEKISTKSMLCGSSVTVQPAASDNIQHLSEELQFPHLLFHQVAQNQWGTKLRGV